MVWECVRRGVKNAEDERSAKYTYEPLQINDYDERDFGGGSNQVRSVMSLNLLLRQLLLLAMCTHET